MLVVGAGTSHLLVEARQLVAEWEERCMYAQQQLDLLVAEVGEAKEDARKAVSAQVPMQSAPTTLPAQRIRATSTNLCTPLGGRRSFRSQKPDDDL